MIKNIILLSILSFSSISEAEVKLRAIEIIGLDHLKPWTAYAEIQKSIGKSVADGRIELYQKRTPSPFEGIQNFCVQFDLTATETNISELEKNLLSIPGIAADEVATIGRLSVIEKCSQK